MDYASVTAENTESPLSPTGVPDLVAGVLSAEIVDQRDNLLLKVRAAPHQPHLPSPPGDLGPCASLPNLCHHLWGDHWG
jgi:hypothetical protein